MAGGCQEVGIKIQDLPDVFVVTPEEREEYVADWAVMHSGNKVNLKNTLSWASELPLWKAGEWAVVTSHP